MMPPDLLSIYDDATERQRHAREVMDSCAHTRSLVVRRLTDDGMTQLEIANFLGLAQSTVWRLLHRHDAR